MKEVYQHPVDNSSLDSPLPSPPSKPSPPRQYGIGDTVEVQSGRFKYAKPIPGGASMRRGGGKRGVVVEMSNASRRRFMESMASLDYVQLAAMGCLFHFVTLTTCPEFWEKTEHVYRALRRFRDRLTYHAAEAGYLGAFVRRELGEKNGMLHYHLVVIGGEKFSRAWLSSVWTRCLGADKPIMVHVSETTDPNRLSKYISKYCSKAAYEGKRRAAVGSDSAEPETNDGASLTEAHTVGNQSADGYTGGRWWYVWGENNLPWAETTTLYGADARALGNRVRRIFRRWKIEKLRQAIDRKTCPGFALRHFSLKQIAVGDRFLDFMQKSAGGFTVLLPPELMERVVVSAAMGEAWNRDRLTPGHIVG